MRCSTRSAPKIWPCSPSALRLTSGTPAPVEDRWITTRHAAEYAGCSVDALHKAMAAREVHFEQNGKGGKAWHRADWIDAWRRGEPA